MVTARAANTTSRSVVGSGIDRIHSYGIAVQTGIVFGFDHDTESIFTETLDFLEAAGVQNATFNILTPYPGTRLYQRLEAEGRILTRDWRKYNSRRDVVFQPKQMSTAELLAGFRYANELVAFIRTRWSFCLGVAGYPEGHVDQRLDQLEIFAR